MALTMQYSGYSKKFRYEVVDSVLKAYKARKKADQKGERPLDRPKECRKEERELVSTLTTRCLDKYQRVLRSTI